MTFKDDMDSDLGNMLTDDEFGYVVTYSKATDGSCNGIFDNDFISVEVGESAPPVSDQKPTLMVRLSDFDTPPAADDTLTVVGEGDFVVLEAQPDGTGATLLILEEA